jgi:hypothetical protein
MNHRRVSVSRNTKAAIGKNAAGEIVVTEGENAQPAFVPRIPGLRRGKRPLTKGETGFEEKSASSDDQIVTAKIDIIIVRRSSRNRCRPSP